MSSRSTLIATNFSGRIFLRPNWISEESGANGRRYWRIARERTLNNP